MLDVPTEWEGSTIVCSMALANGEGKTKVVVGKLLKVRKDTLHILTQGVDGNGNQRQNEVLWPIELFINISKEPDILAAPASILNNLTMPARR